MPQHTLFPIGKDIASIFELPFNKVPKIDVMGIDGGDKEQVLVSKWTIFAYFINIIFGDFRWFPGGAAYQHEVGIFDKLFINTEIGCIPEIFLSFLHLCSFLFLRINYTTN
jgi:hypothetical protein